MQQRANLESPEQESELEKESKKTNLEDLKSDNNIAFKGEENSVEEDLRLSMAEDGIVLTNEGLVIPENNVRFMQIIIEKEKKLGRKMTHEEIEEQKVILTNEAKMIIDEALESGETSRSKLEICKNDGCYNPSRTGSTYCQECSDKWHAINDK